MRLVGAAQVAPWPGLARSGGRARAGTGRRADLGLTLAPLGLGFAFRSQARRFRPGESNTERPSTGGSGRTNFLGFPLYLVDSIMQM